MNAEVDKYYGLPLPTKTCKWGLVLSIKRDAFIPGSPVQWRAVCWFPTRKRAYEYARENHRHEPIAIARIEGL